MADPGEPMLLGPGELIEAVVAVIGLIISFAYLWLRLGRGDVQIVEDGLGATLENRGGLVECSSTANNAVRSFRVDVDWGCSRKSGHRTGQDEMSGQEDMATEHLPNHSTGPGQRALTIAFAGVCVLAGLLIYGAWGSISLTYTIQVWLMFVAFLGSVTFVAYHRWKRKLSSNDPSVVADSKGVLRQMWRTPTSFSLLLIGTCFLLLLDGQLFTNSLVFLTCWATSLVIRLSDPMLKRKRGLGRAWAVFVILLHVLLIAWVALTLPNSYTFQNTFNQRTEEMQKAYHGHRQP